MRAFVRSILLLIVGSLIGLFAARSLNHTDNTIARRVEVATLDSKLTTVDFDNIPLRHALEHVCKQANLDLIVKWNVLKDIQLDADAPITLHVRDVPVGRVLKLLTELAVEMTAQGEPAVTISNNTVVITTLHDLLNYKVTRSYFIKDLLDQDIRADGEDPEALKEVPEYDEADGGLFSGPAPAPYWRTADAISYEIQLLITETIAVDTWRDNGGSVGSIREISGWLIVTTTPEIHNEIPPLLDMLRQDPTGATPSVKNVSDSALDGTKAKLDQVIPLVEFNDMPAVDAINQLRDQTNANILVRWRILESHGVDRKELVNVKLANVTLRQALASIFNEMKSAQFAFGEYDHSVVGVYSQDDVVLVSSKEDISQYVDTRAYYVRDLLHNIMNGTARIPPIPAICDIGADDEPDVPAEYTEATDKLTSHIIDLIAPDTWRDNGGSMGSIRELNGWLLVTTIPEHHSQISKLLKQLQPEPGQVEMGSP